MQHRLKVFGLYFYMNIPHNKGKKWSEWMDGRKQRKVRKCLIHTGNPTLAGWNKRAVLAYKDGVELWFESVTDAARKLNLQRRNVQHVVQGIDLLVEAGGSNAQPFSNME